MLKIETLQNGFWEWLTLSDSFVSSAPERENLYGEAKVTTSDGMATAFAAAYDGYINGAPYVNPAPAPFILPVSPLCIAFSPFGTRELKLGGVMNKHFHPGVDMLSRDRATGSPYTMVACENMLIEKVLGPDPLYPEKFTSAGGGEYLPVEDLPPGRAWTPFLQASAVPSKDRYFYVHMDVAPAILAAGTLHPGTLPFYTFGAGLPISQGTPLGTCLRNLGYSQGAHLHWEVWPYDAAHFAGGGPGGEGNEHVQFPDRGYPGPKNPVPYVQTRLAQLGGTFSTAQTLLHINVIATTNPTLLEAAFQYFTPAVVAGMTPVQAAEHKAEAMTDAFVAYWSQVTFAPSLLASTATVVQPIDIVVLKAALKTIYLDRSVYDKAEKAVRFADAYDAATKLIRVSCQLGTNPPVIDILGFDPPIDPGDKPIQTIIDPDHPGTLDTPATPPVEPPPIEPPPEVPPPPSPQVGKGPPVGPAVVGAPPFFTGPVPLPPKDTGTKDTSKDDKKKDEKKK